MLVHLSVKTSEGFNNFCLSLPSSAIWRKPAQQSCRSASNYGVVFKRLCHHGVRSNDAIFPQLYAVQNNRTAANEAVIANRNWLTFGNAATYRMNIPTDNMIKIQNRNPETYQAIISNSYVIVARYGKVISNSRATTDDDLCRTICYGDVKPAV